MPLSRLPVIVFLFGVWGGIVGPATADVAVLSNRTRQALPGPSSQSNLYSINLLTGAATNLGTIDGGVIVGSIAVAPDGFNPFVPEPSTIALLGLAAMLAGRRRFA